MKKEVLYNPGEWAGECFRCDDDGTNGTVNHKTKKIKCLMCGFEGTYAEEGDIIVVYEESVES